MKFDWKLTAAAGAVSMLVAACGGGGGSVEAPAVPSVSLSGTAATGLALASGNVTVKCAKGGTTGTTDANGKYNLVISDAALPCMIQVSGNAGGTTVTLHSVAQAGTANGADTAAVANVTPLTEMIVAQLNGALPGDIFATFGSSSKITTEQLNTATTAVAAALKDATGIDLGTIDPFKSSLVAATSSAPASGNAYDKLLDAFGTKVPPQALDQIVNQIANAASNTSGNGPVTLKDVMTAVEGGTLEGCATAMSGKYRRLDLYGRTAVYQLDFKSMAVKSADGQTKLFDIVRPSGAQACQFTMTDASSVTFDVIMSNSGLGAYRVQSLVSNPGNSAIPGYLVPVQAHTYAGIVGSWSYLQSGYLPGDGISHFPGQITLAADRAASACDINPSTFQCEPDGTPMNVADRGDGGFDLRESSLVLANMYGYRAPNGSMALFGTTNPSGDRTSTTEQTSLVAFKPQKQELPTVGTTSNYLEVNYFRSGTNNVTDPVMANATTVLATDAAAMSVTRKRASDGRVDVVYLNKPLEGLRSRPAGTSSSTSGGTLSFAGSYQLPLAGFGTVISINSAPSDPTTNAGFFYSISMNR